MPDTGPALLAAVMRTRCREDAAVGAFVDWLLENLPEMGGELAVFRKQRVRTGRIAIWRSMEPQWHRPGTFPYVQVQGFHFRGKRGCRSINRGHLDTDPPEQLAACIREVLAVFRS